MQGSFEEARHSVLCAGRISGGIGTLREKTLHAVLKEYYEPRPECREVAFGPYIADIRNDSGVVEIQTGSFSKLKPKLSYFLKEGPVTVVYPVASAKRIIRIDQGGNPVGTPRKSPKRGTAWEAFSELRWIRPYMGHPNFNLCITLLEWDEYRLQAEEPRRGRHGAQAFDRVPTGLTEEVWLCRAEDYAYFLPPELPPQFTAADLQKTAKIPRPLASAALAVLHTVQAVERVGKKGNAFLYERKYFSCAQCVADLPAETPFVISRRIPMPPKQ